MAEAGPKKLVQKESLFVAVTAGVVGPKKTFTTEATEFFLCVLKNIKIKPKEKYSPKRSLRLN